MNQSQLLRLLDVSNVLPWEADPKSWNFLFVGSQAVKLLGYPVEEWYQDGFWVDHIHPEDREYAVKFCTESAARHAHHEFEYRMIAKDGRVVWLRDHVHVEAANGELSTLRGFMFDITERKQMEEKLRENEERFSQLALWLDEVFWFIALNPERVLYVSPAFERIWGYRPEDIYRDPRIWVRSIHPEDQDTVNSIYDGWLKGSQPVFDVTYRITRLDGSIRWVHDHGVRHLDDNGDVYRLSGIAKDITEQVESERALRESEEKYRLVAETATDAIVTVDEESRIIYANPATQRIFGHDPEALLGRPLTLLMPESFHSHHLTGMRKFIQTGQQSIRWEGLELPGIHRSGRPLVVEVSFGAIRQEKDTFLFTGIMRDITERKKSQAESRRLRDELARMGRINMMGELVATIAHEVNQPLCAIVTNAQTGQRLLAGEAADTHDVKDILADVAEDANRASAVIQRVRDLVKRTQPEQALLDMNEVILEVVGLAQSEAARQEVELRLELGKGLPRVSGDRIQLQQVILNLLLNGMESMRSSKPGIRTLTVHSVSSSSPTVEISVCDTGSGLDPAISDQIFDAFFTTKDGGLGMGLAISRSIVESHGGKLWATPNSDRGTTFHFTLPGCDQRLP